MARKKKEPNRVDDLLDELLEDCHSPEDILGETGLMKQIKKRLVERALAGELNHHLKSGAADESSAPNSRNGSSKKTVQTEDGRWTCRYRETAEEASSRFWCRSINAASLDLTRRSWRSMPGATVRATSAPSSKSCTAVQRYRQRSSARSSRASARMSKHGSPGRSTRSIRLSISMLCM